MHMNRVIFGTMRMSIETNSISNWVELFKQMWDVGITIHHVSSEYDSYNFHLNVLNEFRKIHPECHIDFIVKLAEPHFGSFSFNEELFISHIDKYRKDLNVSTIHSIQWMWRGDINKNEDRLKDFDRDKLLIYQSVEHAKSTQKIKFFHVFPYSIDFAEFAISLDFVDGLIVYRNIIEKEYDDLILRQAKLNKFSYIIRPLAAGKLDFNISKPSDYFKYALDLPSIKGGIISISSVERLNELLT